MNLYNHFSLTSVAQSLISQLRFSSQLLSVSSHSFSIEQEKFILLFIEEVKSQFKFLFHLSTVTKSQKTHHSTESYHLNILSLKIHKESILHQFMKEQKIMRSCNVMMSFTFTCLKLTDSDPQVSEMSEIVLSLCCQCECVFVKLIKNIEAENKEVKVVVVVIDQVHVEKRVRVKICYSY